MGFYSILIKVIQFYCYIQILWKFSRNFVCSSILCPPLSSHHPPELGHSLSAEQSQTQKFNMIIWLFGPQLLCKIDVKCDWTKTAPTHADCRTFYLQLTTKELLKNALPLSAWINLILCVPKSLFHCFFLQTFCCHLCLYLATVNCVLMWSLKANTCFGKYDRFYSFYSGAVSLSDEVRVVAVDGD